MKRRNRSAAVNVVFMSGGAFFHAGPPGRNGLLTIELFFEAVVEAGGGASKKEGEMQDVWMRSSGVVIAFPGIDERPQRPNLPADGPRGEILLFTGVRYERPSPNPGPSRPFASDRPGGRRRS